MTMKRFPWYSRLVWIALISIGVACNQPKVTGAIPVNEDSVRSHILPIEAARGYSRNFRSVRDSFYKQVPGLRQAMDLGQAEAFNRDAIAVLLNQKDPQGNPAAGVRMYYGLDRQGQVRLVLVPYDIHGNDIINTLVSDKTVSIPGVSPAKAFADGGQTIENGQRCPVICDNSSGLNSGN